MDQVYNFVCKTQDTFLIQLVNEICVGIKKRNTLVGKAILKANNHTAVNLSSLVKIHKANDEIGNLMPDRIHGGNINKILGKMIKSSEDINTLLTNFSQTIATV